MAVALTVTIDDRDMREVQRQLASMPKVIPRVLASAINDAARKAKTRISKEIRDIVTLSKKRVEKGSDLKPATPNRLAAIVIYQSRPVGAINFKGRATKKGGVSFQPYKGKGRIKMRHGFKAMLRGRGGENTNAQFALRRMETPTKAFGRLPINVLYGPSLIRVYKAYPRIARAAQEVINETLRARLYSQIDRRLGRAKSVVPDLATLT